MRRCNYERDNNTNHKNNCYDVVGDDEIINSNNIYDDYAIDSLSFINIIMEIESELGISFPDEYLSMDMLSSVENICNALEVSIKTQMRRFDE